jgi:CIC family chloride channel protein
MPEENNMEQQSNPEPEERTQSPSESPRQDKPARGWRAFFSPSEVTVLVILAILVGVGAGLGAIIFIRLIGWGEFFFLGWLRDRLSFMGNYALILIPILGALPVGLLITHVAQEAKGHGVPEIMEAVALRGGRIRPVVVVAKAVASALCIGSGGSVGREGPIAQIGAAVGSTLGQWFRVSDERIRMLVACGSAAGIAATFNAPIAGVFFSLEVILGDFSAGAFGTVVLSSLVASVVSHLSLQDHPVFLQVPQYALVNPWVELPLYLLLGLLAALAATAFVKALYWTEGLFDAWRFPAWLKPAVGGLLLGVVGLLSPSITGGLATHGGVAGKPDVFGSGFGAIEMVLEGGVQDTAIVRALVLLLLCKLLATTFTLGAGNSGGIFAPALFMGAMLGGAFGELAHTLLPQVTALSGAYAIVGMAALFAGAARAPITAILILFEMTGDYRIIVPLMFAVVVSTVVARRLSRESIYTEKLVRRGIQLRFGRDVNVMEMVLVGETMTQGFQSIPESMPRADLLAEFDRTKHHGFPVVDAAGELVGMVTLEDLGRTIATQGPQTVGEICTRDLLVLYPDQTLNDALRLFGLHDVGRIPVVDRANPRRLLGVLRRADVIKAYNAGLARKLDVEERIQRLKMHHLSGMETTEVELKANSVAVGHRIRDIPLPEHSMVVSVRRTNQVVVPHEGMLLQSGDRVTLLADQTHIETARERLVKPDPHPGVHTQYAEFVVTADSAVAGQPIRDIHLGADCLVVTIKRNEELLIPHGQTTILPGDVLVLLTRSRDLEQIAQCIGEQTISPTDSLSTAAGSGNTGSPE